MRINKTFIILICLSVLLIIPVYGAILGVSNIDLKTNVEGFENAWIVSWVDNDLSSDKLNLFLSQSDIEDLSGTQPKQPLSLQITGRENTCEYNFGTENIVHRNIYTIDLIDKFFFPWQYTSQAEFINENCANFNNPPTYDYSVVSSKSSIATAVDGGYVQFNGVFDYRVYCAKKQEKIGTMGNLKFGKLVSKSDWELSVPGKQSQFATISNDETGSGKSSNLGNNAVIQWQGLLSSGESCPNTNNLIGIHSSTLGGWKVVSESNYDTYLNELNNLKNQITRYAIGSATANGIESTFNSKSRAIPNQIISDYRITSSSLDNGKAEFQLDRSITFPLYRLVINADYLEVEINAGIPKIIDVEDVEFTEGDTTGTGIVTVKNIGDFNGAFSLRVFECTNGFSSDFSTGTGNLAPNEIKSFNFLIVGSSIDESKDITGTCKVEMKDTVSQETDVVTFNVKFTQLQDCSPGKKSCGMDGGFHAIKQCNNAGTKYITIETCKADEVCDNLKCVNKGEKEEETNDFNLTLFIVALVIGIIGAVITYNYTKVFGESKGGKIARIVVTGMVFVFFLWFIPTIWHGIVNLFTFRLF